MLKSPSIRIDALLFTVILVAAIDCDGSRYNDGNMRWRMTFFAVVVATAQEPSLLDRVKARADENLRRLPNYTCTETIQRSLRLDRSTKLRPFDNVRLNVAYVEGR